MKKKELIEVRLHKTGKYPRRCTRIQFEMIADGSQYDAVKLLMSGLGLGRYSFVESDRQGQPEKPEKDRMVVCTGASKCGSKFCPDRKPHRPHIIDGVLCERAEYCDTVGHLVRCVDVGARSRLRWSKVRT